MSADDTMLEPAAVPEPAPTSVGRLMLRPTLLFVAGYVINTSLHELAHALAAYGFGLTSTVFHSYVNVNLTDATPYVQSVVRAAGPISSLIVGVLCWFAHRAVRGWWPESPLFYVAVFGVASFLGNVVAVAFVGDFSNLAAALRLSTHVRYAISGIGAFFLIGFAFDIGRELREWAPEGVGALKGAAAVVALPAIVGMAVILLAYQPMAINAMEARAFEGVFWIFAALGALVGSARPARTDVLEVRRVDWLFALAAVLALRVLALGIPLAP